MKRLTGLLLGLAAITAISCGDNSRECGEGTVENEDGFCVASGGTPTTCTDGTILDAESNTCVIDPASCQGGTVLIDNQCVDPTEGLTVDVTEAAEPNGFGVNGEDSDDPAGEFQVPNIGSEPAVLQGNINAQADRNEDGLLEPDIDTYLFEVDGPTLLEISVDGVGGVAGGFVMFGIPTGLETWSRFGVNLTGDTAKRQVFLPSGGIYLFAVADTRTLVLGEPTGDADNKYFVSVSQKAITPTTLAFTSGAVTQVSTVANGEVDFYTAPFDVGINSADLQSYSSEFTGSLVVNVGPAPRVVANESHSTTGGNDTPARALFGGVTATATALIAVDHRLNTSSAAVDYRLNLRTRTAKALKTDGTTETQNNINPAVSNIDGHTLWYFDVNATNAITGIDLAWLTTGDATLPVVGSLVDQNGTTFQTFTALTSTASRWRGYRGLIRTANPGRYYFQVFAPTIAAGAPIIAKSIIADITPDTLTFGTPLDDVAAGPFNAKAYSYAVTSEEWQKITLGADTASGGAQLRFLLPTALGRLGAFTTYNATDVPATLVPAPVANGGPSIAAFQAGASSTINVGRLFKGLPDTVLVVGSTLATTPSTGTFDVGTAVRLYTNEGNHAGPFTVSHMDVVPGPENNVLTFGEPLPSNRYYIETAPGSEITITVTPEADGAPVILALLDNEFDFDGIGSSVDGQPQVYTFVMDGAGYLPFEVVQVGTNLAATYDITLHIDPPPTPPTPAYTVADGGTGWTNICNAAGASDVTPLNRDDALTGVITLPTGFDFFANAKTAIKISTNGWLTFDTAVTDFGGAGTAIPTASGPNDLVAAYWDDLANVRICTLTQGTKFIVQWRGNIFGFNITIAAQAILDTADDTIELVYAPYHQGDGVAASAGIESASGAQGISLFFDEEPVPAGTSKKLTPNP